jgi:hypothetical protein
MAARAHLAENVGDAGALVQDAVDGREPGADGSQRRLPGLRREHRIGVEPHGLLSLAGAHALDPVDVALRMRQRDLLFYVVAQRRLLAL